MDTIIDSDSVDMGSIPVRDTRKTGVKTGLFAFAKENISERPQHGM